MANYPFDLPVRLHDFDIDIATVFLLACHNHRNQSATVELGDFARCLPRELNIGKIRERFDRAIDRIADQILLSRLHQHNQQPLSALPIDRLSIDTFTSSLFDLDSKVTISLNERITTQLEEQRQTIPSLLPLIKTNNVACIALYYELITRPNNTDILTIRRPRLEKILATPKEANYSEIKEKYLMPALSSILSVTGQTFEITTEVKTNQITQAIIIKKVHD